MSGPVTVLVADDDILLRRTLAALVGDDPALELVGAAADAQEAIDIARAVLPRVAVLDVRMPRGGGIRAAREIRVVSPGTIIIALTAYDDRATVREMFAAGADGYLVKGTSPKVLLSAVHRAAAGGRSLSEKAVGAVVDELAERLTEERAEIERLSGLREQTTRILRGEEELSILYQPIVDLTSLAVVGFEALARIGTDWSRSPSDWLADAAVVDLAMELEITLAARAIAHLPSLVQGTFLSVNLSPATVATPAFRAIVEAAPGDRLVVEVTEHVPVEDYPALRDAMEYARRRGVRLAIDDAGAGYASLRHVVQLQPDFIKLDISLTRGVDHRDWQLALASALVGFARDAGASVIAEGIETGEELRALKTIGVPLGQGFYLGRPEPIAPEPAGQRTDAVGAS